MVSAPSMGTGFDAFERMYQGYAATRPSRLRSDPVDLPWRGAGPDYHYGRDEFKFLKLVEMCRDFERNEPVIQAAFNRLVANVIGPGFTLDPRTGDQEVDKRLLERWHGWADDPNQCDAAGEMTFPEMESTGFRSVARDGDVYTVPLTSGRLAWYESHRNQTPQGVYENVVNGVHLGPHHRKLGYFFTDEPLEPWKSSMPSEPTYIPATDKYGFGQVFHLYEAKRFNQSRGVPWCAPTVDTIDKHGRIQFARMVQQQMVSCYALLVTRGENWKPEDQAATVGSDSDATKPVDRDEYLKNLQRTWDQMFPGMVFDGLPGEQLQAFSSGVPNAEFFPHVMLLLSFIAVNLDLPVQVLMLDPTKTNFSGWRGAVDEARKRFQQMQAGYRTKFHRRTYRWKVRQWLKTDIWLQDAMLGGLDVFAHNWNPRAWDYIEPHKDAAADELAIRGAHNSRHNLFAKRGHSYDDVMPQVFEELESELDEALAITERLNAKYEGKQIGKPLDWREVASARGVIPSPMVTSLSAKLGDEQPTPEPVEDLEAAA